MKRTRKAKNKKKKGIQVNTVGNKLNGICVGRLFAGSKCRLGLGRRWFMDKVFHSSCLSFNKSRIAMTTTLDAKFREQISHRARLFSLMFGHQQCITFSFCSLCVLFRSFSNSAFLLCLFLFKFNSQTIKKARRNEREGKARNQFHRAGFSSCFLHFSIRPAESLVSLLFSCPF